jgi:phosphopantothenoylcysteine decarboxylase/phosphopantothenate--cysteine ligase
MEEARTLLSNHDLSALRILVTAGPTVEPMDPVRQVTNRSTGRMGYALARAARRRGAEVILVSGPTSLQPPYGVDCVHVKTAEEMREAVLGRRAGCHVIIKAAAVSDYRPKETAEQKIKKGAETLSMELEQNPDILAELGKTKDAYPCLLVGFAAETEDLLTHARQKLEAKNLDMIVANDVSRKDAGFEAETNTVKMIYGNGTFEEAPLMPKDEVADLVLDRARALLDGDRGDGKGA